MTAWDFFKYLFNLAYEQWMVTALFLYIIANAFYGGRNNE